MLSEVRAVKNDYGSKYALHFHLSALHPEYNSEFQQRIAVNIINDVFRDQDGYIFAARDGDIFAMYYGEERSRLEKSIFQVRYLYADDKLAYNNDGSENDDFCTTYDLAFQWRPFYRLCSERMETVTQAQNVEVIPDTERTDLLTPRRLAAIEAEMQKMELELAMRTQPICAVKQDTENVRPVYNEAYVNMVHFRQLLNTECNLFSDLWLFKYLTEVLDKYVLDIISGRPTLYMKSPVSLNLNIKTVLSDHFTRFFRAVSKHLKPSIVVEIQVADVFADMPSFLAVRELVQEKYGQRICIDGLNTDSFVQVDREKLGFDLAKLQWNADLVGDLDSDANYKLKEAIKKCGANRIILCRCDNKYAIEYGHALGISLFQGRHTDKIINPEATIVN